MQTRRNRGNNGYISDWFEPCEMGIITPAKLYALECETDGYGMSEPSIETTWSKPSDWLAMPDMTGTDQKVAMLLHITKGASGTTNGATADTNFIAFSLSGAYIVDWGDGTTQAFAAGDVAQYAYLFESLSGGSNTETVSGDRQIIVQAYPQSGSDFKNLNLNQVYSGNGVTGLSAAGGFPQPIVHLKMCGATFSSVDLGQGFVSGAGGLTGTLAYFPNLRLFEYVGPSSITNGQGLFGGVSRTSININIPRCPRFEYVYGSEWTSNITNFANMFNGTKIAVAPYLNTSNGTTFSGMYSGCQNLRYVPEFDTSNAEDLSALFASSFCLDGIGIPTLNAPKVRFLSGMLGGCYGLRRFVRPIFRNLGKNLNANMNIDMTSFLGNIPARDVRRAFVGVDTSKVRSISEAFYGCSALRYAPNINLSGLTGQSIPFSTTKGSASLAFANCFALTWVPPYNLGNTWSTYGMFTSCYSLKNVPNFNFSSVGGTGMYKDMSSMFGACYALTSWGRGTKINTESFTNFNGMFAGCYSMMDAPNLDMAEAITASTMFQNCYSLTNIPIYNTAKVVAMNSMFSSCSGLTFCPDLNLSSCKDFSSMFSNCYILEKAIPMSSGTGLTPNANSMYSNCYNLSEIPSGFNLSNIRSIASMFNGCSSLTKIPYFDSSQLQNIFGAFSSCRPTTFPYLDVGGITHNNNQFSFANMSTFAWGGLSGTRTSINYTSCNLSPTALNDIFTGLSAGKGGLTGGTIRTITITNNWGATGCDRTIATAKGWTVTG